MPSSLRWIVVGAVVWVGCEEKKAQGPAPQRFAGVKKAGTQAERFCEKEYPPQGPEARRFQRPALRPFNGGESMALGSGWTWVNVWATWCRPCVEEMGLLTRWSNALGREGAKVSFALLSIDEENNQAELEGWNAKNLPGPIHWLRGEEDLGPFLDALGVDRSAAIPIHALVDGKGNLRCVRVGAIHEQDYGTVRSLLAGG